MRIEYDNIESLVLDSLVALRAKGGSGGMADGGWPVRVRQTW